MLQFLLMLAQLNLTCFLAMTRSSLHTSTTIYDGQLSLFGSLTRATVSLGATGICWFLACVIADSMPNQQCQGCPMVTVLVTYWAGCGPWQCIACTFGYDRWVEQGALLQKCSTESPEHFRLFLLSSSQSGHINHCSCPFPTGDRRSLLWRCTAETPPPLPLPLLWTFLSSFIRCSAVSDKRCVR